MTNCQIFAAFFAVDRIRNEIEALIDEFMSGLKILSKGSIVATTTQWFNAHDTESPPNGVNFGCNITCKLRSTGRGPARERILTFYFDLARDLISTETTDWPHARESLLVIGFDPNLAGDSWRDFASVTPHGHLRHKDAWNGCKNHVFADGRLLEWKDASVAPDGGWSQRAWIFALPLRRLTNAAVVAEQITNPVAALLFNRPETILEETDSVRWNLNA